MFQCYKWPNWVFLTIARQKHILLWLWNESKSIKGRAQKWLLCDKEIQIWHYHMKDCWMWSCGGWGKNTQLKLLLLGFDREVKKMVPVDIMQGHIETCYNTLFYLKKTVTAFQARNLSFHKGKLVFELTIQA